MHGSLSPAPDPLHPHTLGLTVDREADEVFIDLCLLADFSIVPLSMAQ